MAIRSVVSSLPDPKYVQALEDELREMRQLITALRLDVNSQQGRK